MAVAIENGVTTWGVTTWGVHYSTALTAARHSRGGADAQR
jgi:hypothetical protein